MFNFKEAFTYIFKERKWGVKFLISYISTAILALEIIFGLVSTAGSGPSNPNDTIFTAFLMCCAILSIAIFGVIFFAFAQGWYQYENIEAGMENRPTTGIWRVNKEELLKKVGKIWIFYFIFGVISYICLIFINILVSIIFDILTRIHIYYYSSTETYNLITNEIMYMVIVLMIFTYMIINWGILRFIWKKSFREGFNLKAIFKTIKNYYKHFLTLTGIFALFYGISAVAFFLNGKFITFLIDRFPRYDSSPAYIGLITGLIILMFLDYLFVFVFPRLQGQAFRDILKKEDFNK